MQENTANAHRVSVGVGRLCFKKEKVWAGRKMKINRNKISGWLRRSLEAWRGWKRMWKALSLLGVIAVVAITLFFSIPSPYRDAWDDLLLPYPKEFPGPGVYGRDIGEAQLHYLTRAETLSLEDIDPYMFFSKRPAFPQQYSYAGVTFVGIVEIQNYVDVIYKSRTYCLAVCKVVQVIAQREDVTFTGDIITVQISGSSKISTVPYGELGVGQKWMMALGYAQRIIAGEILAPADSEYYVADYTTRGGWGDAFAIPVYTNISGDYYADLSCVAEPNAEIRYDEDSAKYNMYTYYPVEQVPMQDLKIYNFNAYGNFLEKEFEKFPYSPQMGGESKFPYKIRLLEERADEE